MRERSTSPSVLAGKVLPVLLMDCIFLLTGCGYDKKQPEMTIAEHLNGMTDPAIFSRLFDGQTHLSSSYDRSGGNDDWTSVQTGANETERDLLSLKGPGCLTRIWYTGLQAKDFRIFIDGADTPRMIFTGWDMLGDKVPFSRPLSGASSGGVYSYLPVPFEKSLRLAITVPPGVTPDKRQYFHVNAVTYDPDARVTGFRQPLSATDSNALHTAAEAWKHLAAEYKTLVASGFAGFGSTDVAVAPGQRTEWLRQGGAGQLTAFALRLTFKPETTPLARSLALREVVLRIRFDGSNAASVDVPLGDFFCNAFHSREFAALPLAHVDDWYICRFPMPFRKGLRAELVNAGKTSVGVNIRHRLAPPPQNPGEGRYFHARWTQQSSNGTPLPILSTRGHGYFVGCYLNAIAMEPSWYILEGDESFRVDGEATPSWHGTGLEDYFNGAWYYSGLFDLPLHGLLEKGAMRTGQYRFHVHDAVRFRKSLDMQFEFGDQNASKGYMSSVAYWYQDQPVASGSVIPPAAERHLPRYALEPATAMAELFELERIGHLAEARERCLAYAEKYARSDFSDILTVRAAAYEEAQGQKEPALAEYTEAVKAKKGAAAGQQAQALAWFHENPSNTLIAAHANGSFRIYLDGAPVLSGTNVTALAVRPVQLAAGEHELTAEVVSAAPDGWFSCAVRAHGTNFFTDALWEVSRNKPALWPRSGGRGQGGWVTATAPGAGEMLPRLSSWSFVPNAFVNAQSNKQLLRPWPGWDARAGNTAYLRRRFTIPAQ